MSPKPNKILVCLACSLLGKIIDKMPPLYTLKLRKLQITLFESIFYDSMQLRTKRAELQEDFTAEV